MTTIQAAEPMSNINHKINHKIIADRLACNASTSCETGSLTTNRSTDAT
ncbi:MAG: hypothetical protein OXI96_04030 [Acidimicrobiaceae bacterium]|nr:hypothetical protein [Acidimicrobiaceae bacterium]